MRSLLSRPPTDLASFIGRKWLESITINLNRTNRTIVDFYTEVGNTGTAESDLYSTTLQANLLDLNGDKILAEYSGTFISAGAGTRQLKIYFAGNVILDTGALTIAPDAAWTAYITIIKVSATSAFYSVTVHTAGITTQTYTATDTLTGLDLTTTNILKITGTGAATNDILAKLGTVEWRAAA